MLTKIDIEILEDGKILDDACPVCQGDMREARHRRFVQLTSTKRVPINTLEHIFICDDCGETQKRSYSYLFLENEAERKQHLATAQNLTTKATMACMTYAANIDGDYAVVEAHLLAAGAESPVQLATLRRVVENVRRGGREAENYVFGLMDLACQHLTVTQLVYIISETARMILVDGQITPAEQKLLKKLMRKIGLSWDLYPTVMERALHKLALENPALRR